MPARRHRPLRLLGALLALTLLGAACSDDDSADDPTIQDDGTTDDTSSDDGSTDEGTADEGDDGGPEAIDACALLTAADLQEAFTSPWDDGEAVHQEQTGGDQCTWTNLDAPPVKTFSVVVYTTQSLEGTAVGQAAGDAAEYYELNKAAATVDEELEIGDEAFRSATNVWVLDGDTVYNFSTFLGDDDDATTGLVSLAEKAVDG